MTFLTLYWHRDPLPERLSIGYLRTRLPDSPVWISLEPRSHLPFREGKYLRGRIPGLSPLCRTLPENLDDLPLLSASFFGPERWQHFHDAHPLSQQPGFLVTWSLQPFFESNPLSCELPSEMDSVLSWQDRDRFGLAKEQELPICLNVQRFLVHGKQLTWRLIPEEATQ